MDVDLEKDIMALKGLWSGYSWLLVLKYQAYKDLGHELSL